jgi:pilus assembly protein CpaF
MTIRSFAAGEVIYKEGDAAETAFVILSGEVELTHNGHRRTFVSGEIFGEVSLIQEEPRADTATAKSAVSAQVLTETQVEELVYESPPEIQKIIKNISKHTPASFSGGSVAMSPMASVQLPAAASATALPADQAKSMLGVMEGLERMSQQMEKRCELMEYKLQRLSAEAAPAQDDSPAYSALTRELVTQLSNLGPLMPLLEDETINDILINGPENIYVERKGLLVKTDITFPNDSEVLAIAEKIVKAVGRKIDTKRPLVDARLLDGSRVNIIAPPLAVDGTSISIRKFSKKKITLDVMKESKNASVGLAEFLKVIGKCRLNIVVSGGTGSGKTTLLNAISQHIDPTERIVTIEDAAELQLQQPHVIRLETRPYHVGMRREEEVSMRDLVKNALRMRPDRILVGEVRGPEAFDMMQAMNTGHEGSLTTVHANHPRDALSRLENMISMADLQIPMKSLRQQIASALHVIVQISRMRDGHRRVTYVSEVVGMEGDMVTMHDLYNFVQTGEDEKGGVVGEFKWSGIMPRFVRRVAYYGELTRLEGAFGVKLPKNF